MLALRDAFRGFSMRFLPNNNYVKAKAKIIAQQEKLAELKQAKKDWEFARQFFNLATEPELIDYAIYAMEAAEKRYIYILKNLDHKEFSPEIIFNMYFNN